MIMNVWTDRLRSSHLTPFSFSAKGGPMPVEADGLRAVSPHQAVFCTSTSWFRRSAT